MQKVDNFCLFMRDIAGVHRRGIGYGGLLRGVVVFFGVGAIRLIGMLRMLGLSWPVHTILMGGGKGGGKKELKLGSLA